jgi:hypothetical protein
MSLKSHLNILWMASGGWYKIWWNVLNILSNNSHTRAHFELKLPFCPEVKGVILSVTHISIIY